MTISNYGMAKLVAKITNKLRYQPFIPLKTGHLRMDGIYGSAPQNDLGVITFDTNRVDYIDFLEFGTEPHNILGAFGRTDYWQPYAYLGDLTVYPFGVGGRFNNKFHPGSKKHVGFIAVKSVQFVIDEICKELDGKEVKKWFL